MWLLQSITSYEVDSFLLYCVHYFIVNISSIIVTYLCVINTIVTITAIGPATTPKMMSVPATLVYAETNMF